MQNKLTPRFLSRLPKWKLGLGLAVLAGAAIYLLLANRTPANPSATFTARRGNLQISVLEGGSMEAQEFMEIRSEVKGYQGTKILSIVEEGYQVTEDDVKKGKLLVELDSSELRQRIVTQDIEYQARSSSLTEAQQAYEIQLTQNKSDVKAAEVKAKFALLDMEKYLGDKVSNEILARLGLQKPAEILASQAAKPIPLPSNRTPKPEPDSAVRLVGEAKSPGLTGAFPDDKFISLVNRSSPPPVLVLKTNAPPAEESPAPPGETTDPVVIDFAAYPKVELLGDGEAQQKLREAKDGLLLAEKEKSASQAKLAGTERLQKKGFVTKTELETAQLEFEQVDLKVKKAATALNLFIKYELIKSAEEFLSKYQESLILLERAQKEALSKLAQAHAKRMSAESQFAIVEKAKKELEEQVEKCVIRASKPGLVTYGGSNEGYYNSEERIREGALIRERQPILTIPNTSRMSVKVKIPESQIKKIKKGMRARILVEAFPDEKLQGEVIKVAVLPDAQNRWMNPDMKVYVTTIGIEGTYPWMKPGMTAKVEILVNELKDVIYIPIQAVFPNKNQHICHVRDGKRTQRRVVELGDSNDNFVQITSGIKEGEQVVLRSLEPSAEPGMDKPRQNSNPATPARGGPPPQSARPK